MFPFDPRVVGRKALLIDCKVFEIELSPDPTWLIAGKSVQANDYYCGGVRVSFPSRHHNLTKDP